MTIGGKTKPIKTRVAAAAIESCVIIGGGILFAMALNMFLLPGSVILGGATGAATVLGIIFGFPIGITIIVINIPLVLINLRTHGMRFLGRTIAGIAVTSAAADLIVFFPVTITDPLLCALFGGVTMGAGAGLLLSRGYTTGGSDLAGWYLKRKLSGFSLGGFSLGGLSLGRIIMLVDLAVILSAAAALRNFTGIIYSVVAAYSYSAVLDYFLSGSRSAVTALIITARHEPIADGIFRDMNRGLTVLDGRGWYTGAERKVIVCVFKKSELYRIKMIIKTADPDAFVSFCESPEVLGLGFEIDGRF